VGFIFALSTFSLGNLSPRTTPLDQGAAVGRRPAHQPAFFGSVLFHELAHSVVAQHYKIRVVSITLFIFGGLARIARDPSKSHPGIQHRRPGPLASFFLFGVFAVLEKSFPHSEMLGALAGWLAFINFVWRSSTDSRVSPGRRQIFRAIVWG